MTGDGFGAGRAVEEGMANSGGKAGRSREDSGTHGARRSGGARVGADGRRTIPFALPANLRRALRNLDDGELERLRDAVAAEARRRGRRDGKTAEGETRRRPAPVTPGQERLVLAAFEAGLKPAAIAREFRLSRAQVESVVAAAKPGRR